MNYHGDIGFRVLLEKIKTDPYLSKDEKERLIKRIAIDKHQQKAKLLAKHINCMTEREKNIEFIYHKFFPLCRAYPCFCFKIPFGCDVCRMRKRIQMELELSDDKWLMEKANEMKSYPNDWESVLTGNLRDYMLNKYKK